MADALKRMAVRFHHGTISGAFPKIQAVLSDPDLHTPDLGGKATTKEVGWAVAAAVTSFEQPVKDQS